MILHLYSLLYIYLLYICTVMKNLLLHRVGPRGHADHGWLDTWRTFSSGNNSDPDRMHFGALRVLNDDTVGPGMGFGTHAQVIEAEDVQVMSSGTGITHSERARDHDKPVHFRQIWAIPRESNVAPRYDQMTLPAGPDDALRTIISPDPNASGLWMHQDAWFLLGHFVGPVHFTYAPQRAGNGVYTFLIVGEALRRRPGAATAGRTGHPGRGGDRHPDGVARWSAPSDRRTHGPELMEQPG